MSNKVKDISIKNCRYYFYDIRNMKTLTKKLASKGLQKKSYSLHWICDDQRFERRTN